MIEMEGMIDIEEIKKAFAPIICSKEKEMVFEVIG
jgi:hypothetical protein